MGETPEALRGKAERYRKLAVDATDLPVIQALRELADRYEEIALELERVKSTTSAKQVTGSIDSLRSEGQTAAEIRGMGQTSRKPQ